MSMFAVFGRRHAPDPTTDLEIPAVPKGFEALGETLVSGGNVTLVCSEIGRALATDGAALSDVLEGLAGRHRRVPPPPTKSPKVFATKDIGLDLGETAVETEKAPAVGRGLRLAMVLF